MKYASRPETQKMIPAQGRLEIATRACLALRAPAAHGWLLSILFGSVLMTSMQLEGHAQLNIPASYKMGGSLEKGVPAGPARLWHYGTEGNSITSNVPLNEINTRAFRQFGKMFTRIQDETWFKNKDGYIVSFLQNLIRNQVYFNRKGAFQYSIRYYEEKDMSAELSRAIKRRFPDYRVNVVTEIMNGEKTLYLVKIENHSSVKTISIVDGRMEITEDLVNGGQG